MLIVYPERRITAVEALMHDYCITNKVNYRIRIDRESLVIPSAEEFLSQYSYDRRSQRRSVIKSMRDPSFANLSNGSIRTEPFNLIKVGNPDKARKCSLVPARSSSLFNDLKPNLSIKHNSNSTNDSSILQSRMPSQNEETDSLSFMISSLMGERKLVRDNSIVISRSEAHKKSKFAD